MPTIEAELATGRKTWLLAASSGFMAVAVAVALFAWWNRPPQMGADEEVFNTVDALFTAVTSHNEKSLAQCEQRLATYREAGKLPAVAADSLTSIIVQARAGSWDSASRRLYDFMNAQRREGADVAAARQKKSTGKGATAKSR